MRPLLTIIIATVALLQLRPAAAQQSLEALKTLATQGDLNAAIAVGQRYRDGQGVKQDHVEALKWYRLSADQGSARGQDNVGFMYLRGWGVKKNYGLAVAYFKQSGEGKHGQGLFNLGNCHFSGQGVEQNYQNAMRIWEQAAELGHERAAWRLAVLHAAGEGTPQNIAKAKEICRGLVKKNVVNGMLLLGEILYEEGNVEGARKLWQQAADQKSEIGQALIDIADWRGNDVKPGQSAYVDVGHLYQGWNNCGATTMAMLARTSGCETDPYVIKRLCPRNPIGTGTDWADLVEAGEKLKQEWQLVTFANDAEGFKEGTAVIRQHLDADRPVVIDFTYVREELGVIRRNGHTLLVVGYRADKDLYVLKNPNQPPPGIQLMTAEELSKNWYSRGYSRFAKGVTSRPLILLSAPLPSPPKQ